MTSRILKPVDLTKTQKSRYLENKTLLFLQIKKFIKAACSVKTNTTWTTKNTTFFHYSSKKFKTNTLQSHKRYINIFELKINNLCSNFSCKNDIISLKNSTFRELQVLIKLIFRYNFPFSILLESSKQCLIFPYFSAVFEFWELSKSVVLRVQSHLKTMLDLKIIRSTDN